MAGAGMISGVAGDDDVVLETGLLASLGVVKMLLSLVLGMESTSVLLLVVAVLPCYWWCWY